MSKVVEHMPSKPNKFKPQYLTHTHTHTHIHTHTMPFTIAFKNKILRNKSNESYTRHLHRK
jgi:hypothetical protein